MAIKRCTLADLEELGEISVSPITIHLLLSIRRGKYSYLSRRSLQSAETDPRVRKSANRRFIFYKKMIKTV